MPTYPYHCEECDYYFEEFQSGHDSPLIKCPECGKDSLERLITGGSHVFVRGDKKFVGDLWDRSGKLQPGDSGYEQAAKEAIKDMQDKYDKKHKKER